MVSDPNGTNNAFYADVPLVAGANTLTASLTTQTGQTATQSITVNSDGVTPAVQISASPVVGVVPLTVTYTVSNGGMSDVNVQFNGSPSGALAAGSEMSLTQTFGGTITYPVTISATDQQGATTSKSFVIVVNDAARMDQMLKAIWDGMNNALIAGDKNPAMTYLNSAAQAKYGPVFDALLPGYAQIANSFSPPAKADISNDIGEYLIRRLDGATKRLYFIYFLRDPDGVWRIAEM